MSSLFGSAPPPPPVMVPPPPAPVPKMPDVASPNAREAALAQVTTASGMSRDGTNMTKKRQTLGGGGSATPSAPPTSADTFNNKTLG